MISNVGGSSPLLPPDDESRARLIRPSVESARFAVVLQIKLARRRRAVPVKVTAAKTCVLILLFPSSATPRARRNFFFFFRARRTRYDTRRRRQIHVVVAYCTLVFVHFHTLQGRSRTLSQQPRQSSLYFFLRLLLYEMSHFRKYPLKYARRRWKR